MATPPLKAQKVFALMQVIGGFVAALDIIAPQNKVDGKELKGAWQAVADRLEVSCKSLARLGGAQEDSAPVCKVLKPCAELQP